MWSGPWRRRRSAAWRRTPASSTSCETCCCSGEREGKAPEYRRQVTAFALKFQQYTAPVQAKGMEDTAFYRYHRLASLNEVGGDPRRFGISVAAFHRANQERARRWPHAMLSTSTHDSKRAEDVRARIHVLSEFPAEWRTHLQRWRKVNRGKRSLVDGEPAPVAQRRVSPVPDAARRLAARSARHGRTRGVSRQDPGLHVEGNARGEGAQQLDQPESFYEEAVSGFVAALFEPGPRRTRFLRTFCPSSSGSAGSAC